MINKKETNGLRNINLIQVFIIISTWYIIMFGLSESNASYVNFASQAMYLDLRIFVLYIFQFHLGDFIIYDVLH